MRHLNRMESLEVRRVLNAGALDTLFGNGGLFVPDPDSPEGHPVPTDLAVQADGKLLYLGIGYNDVAPVVRLNANGTVDTTFGQDGLARSGYGPYVSSGVALAVGPQGKIAAAGYAAPYRDELPQQATLVVYNADGTLDTTFDGDGIVTAPQFPRGFSDVTVQPDGKVVVVGPDKLVRYNANGTPDATFGGGDGIVDFGGRRVLIDASGRPVVLGFFALYRFNADGTPDRTFDGDGVRPSVKGTDLALAPGGDLLVIGNGGNGDQLSRLNADGSADTAFGHYGSAFVPGGTRLAVTASDIYVGGTAPSLVIPFSDFEIRAYDHAGRPDTAFGSGGRVQTDVNGASNDKLVALAMQDGKLVALGETESQPGTYPFRIPISALARYLTTADQPVGQASFTGTPVPLPGGISAADFDKGGEGVAYHDTDAANVGGFYRTAEGVDIQNKTAGGPYVGFVRAGEWLEYTVNVSAAGYYDAFVGTAHLGTGGQFHLELDGKRLTNQLTAWHGRDWMDFASVGQSAVYLPAGQHVLRLAFDTNGSYGYVGNFLNVVFRNHVGPTRSPFLGQPAKAGERIESENYDVGGDGVTYRDTDAANVVGAYRPYEGVDVEPTTDAGGGYNVGFLKAGEWQEYTVDFAQAGPFTLNVRAAALRGGGSFRVLVDGASVATFDVTDTGGWQAYRTLTKAGVNVSAGQHVVRFQMDRAGSTGYVVNLNWFEFRKA